MTVLSFAVEFVALVLLVDLLGGFFHWLEDTYGSESTPIVGRHVVLPNIVHHSRPMEFTKSTFLARNLITICLATFFAFLSYLAGVLTPAWGAALMVGAMSNQVHYYAHLKTRDVPKCILWLQRMKILQTREHHVGGHHGKPFDACYCVLTNVVNPVVDRLQVWQGLEWTVLKVTGVAPRQQH